MHSQIEEPSFIRLYQAAKKLRGMAYLIEAKGEPASFPEDMEEVNSGIALVFEDLASDIREAAEEVEFQDDQAANHARNQHVCKHCQAKAHKKKKAP